MKKIILLSVIILLTLVSCSTDDLSTYDNNKTSGKTVSNTETNSDFCITCRDSITRDNEDGLLEPEDLLESVNPKPIKP